MRLRVGRHAVVFVVAALLACAGCAPTYSPAPRPAHAVAVSGACALVDDGTVRRATLYQEASSLASISAAQLAFARTLPGAAVPSADRPVVRFPLPGPTAAGTLDVPARFRRWADGDVA